MRRGERPRRKKKGYHFFWVYGQACTAVSPPLRVTPCRHRRADDRPLLGFASSHVDGILHRWATNQLVRWCYQLTVFCCACPPPSLRSERPTDVHHRGQTCCTAFPFSHLDYCRQLGEYWPPNGQVPAKLNIDFMCKCEGKKMTPHVLHASSTVRVAHNVRVNKQSGFLHTNYKHDGHLSSYAFKKHDRRSVSIV